MLDPSTSAKFKDATIKSLTLCPIAWFWDEDECSSQLRRYIINTVYREASY